MPGDFERQSALLIGVNELLPHHPHVLTGLVSALIDRLPLIAVITGEEQRRDLLTMLCDWGLPAHRIRAVRAPGEAGWLRDYGPSFTKRDGRVCALRSQQADDGGFPDQLARLLEVGSHDVPQLVGGRHLLSNGRGAALMTGQPAAVSAHYGFRHVLGVSAPVADVATFTAPDTLLVGRCDGADDDGADDPATAALLDRLADDGRGTDSGAGPLKVERIPTPGRRAGAGRGYTGAVFANDVVIVPTYAGVDDRVERRALDTYRRLLPGREVLTVDATSLAAAGGSLRCVTLNIPHLGHPMAFADAATPPPAAAGDNAPRPRLDAFVTSSGWFGPRRSVMRMEV